MDGRNDEEINGRWLAIPADGDDLWVNIVVVVGCVESGIRTARTEGLR